MTTTTTPRERPALRRSAAALVLALAALVAFWAAPAAAQSPLDYQRLIGGTGGAAEEEAPARTPLQSLPQIPFDPESVPSAEEYGRLDPSVNAASGLGAARNLIEVFRARALAIIRDAPRAKDDFFVTLEAASPTGEPSYFLGVAVFSLLLLAIGRAVKMLFVVYVAGPLFVAVQRPDPRGYLEKLPVLAYRLLLTLIGSAIALATAAAIGLVYYDGHEATLTTVIVIFASYGAFMAVDTIWRMGLCPYLPRYRLPTVSNGQARRMYHWLSAVSAGAIAVIAFCYWIKALGIASAAHVLITVVLTLAVVLALVLALRRNRATVRDAILSGQERAEASWLTLATLHLWMPVAVVYLFGSWAKLAFDMVMGVEARPLALVVPYLVLLGGVLVYALTNYAIERVFARSRRMAEINRAETAARAEAERADAERLAADMQREGFGGSADVDGDGEEEGGGPAVAAAARPLPMRGRGMRTFEDLARRVASLVAIGAAAYGLLYYWGGPAIFAETMALGIAEDVIDILLIGYVLFHAIRIWMDQKIAEEVGDEPASAEPGEGEGGGTGATRLATLLPLVRNFVLTLIAIAIFLVVATELGVNVAPLFAGAGILGLAIGFGSQTLVRDILSGAFFLMDDAFRKGEYIDVGSVKGTVEKISLRSFQLRHHLGMLHTIPFGELQFLTNYSRDWVMMKLPLRVTYDTDVEKVRKLIKKLGQELLEDPTIGDKFLAPLKSQGVIQMDDSAMIVRVKFMTKPGEQWVIRKRVYAEIRALFEREGIKFAHREVTVRIPDLPKDREPNEAERRAIGAASRTALDVVEAEALPATGTAGTGDIR